MSNEFYVECYLDESSGPTKIADLACERSDSALQALAENLARMYRPEDAGRIQFRLRGASASDVASVGAALKEVANAPIRQAWAVASAAVTSGGQRREFNPEDLAPESWVSQVTGTAIGSAVWRDASWGNNAAPSWELADGNLVLGEVFYYTTDNGERFTEHFEGRPYVSVVMFDEDENPTVAFESSPDDFLTIAHAAGSRTGPPADALVRAAEGVPQDGRIYWDRDI
ncbi:MAG: hypothetical protein NT024_00485 [Proteobacteria bacterium]|nr:hypothetical protein [Pseudomonadota bacterium]